MAKTLRAKNLGKVINLEKLSAQAEALLQEEDEDHPDCHRLIDQIELSEFAMNGFTAIREKNIKGPWKTEEYRRRMLFARCVLPKKGERRGHLDGVEEAEKDTQALVEAAVSHDWRLGDCEPVVKSLLDANAMLGRIFGLNGKAPANVRELRNIRPRILQRCLRRRGEMASEIKAVEEADDGSAQRFRLLELDGASKRRKKRRNRR